MMLKQTKKIVLIGVFVAMGFVGFVMSSNSVAASTCGGVTTSIVYCKQSPCPNDSPLTNQNKCADGSTPNTKVQNSGFWGILIVAINILTAGIGIVAIGGVTYASILYTSAGGNAEQVKKAMGMITNTVIGVIAYGLMFSLLNFLIPGGLFNK